MSVNGDLADNLMLAMIDADSKGMPPLGLYGLAIAGEACYSFGEQTNVFGRSREVMTGVIGEVVALQRDGQIVKKGKYGRTWYELTEKGRSYTPKSKSSATV